MHSLNSASIFIDKDFTVLLLTKPVYCVLVHKRMCVSVHGVVIFVALHTTCTFVHASVQESTGDSFLLSFFDLQQKLIRDVYPNWNQLWKFVSDCMQVRMYVCPRL